MPNTDTLSVDSASGRTGGLETVMSQQGSLSDSSRIAPRLQPPTNTEGAVGLERDLQTNSCKAQRDHRLGGYSSLMWKISFRAERAKVGNELMAINIARCFPCSGTVPNTA